MPMTGAERSRKWREKFKRNEQKFNEYKRMANDRMKEYRKKMRIEIEKDEHLLNEYRERDRIRKRIQRAKKKAAEGKCTRSYKRKPDNGIDHLNGWFWNEVVDENNDTMEVNDSVIEEKEGQINLEQIEDCEMNQLNASAKNVENRIYKSKECDRIRAKEYRDKIRMIMENDEKLLNSYREKDRIRKRNERDRKKRNENGYTHQYISRAKIGEDNSNELNWTETDIGQKGFDNLETFYLTETDAALNEEKILDENNETDVLSETIADGNVENRIYKSKGCDRIRAKEYRDKIRMIMKNDEKLLNSYREKDRIRKRNERARKKRIKNGYTHQYISIANIGENNSDEWNWTETDIGQKGFDNLETLYLIETDTALNEKEILDENNETDVLSETIADGKSNEIYVEQSENYRIIEPKVEIKEEYTCENNHHIM